jgi:restriction endonuclease Mrr
MSISEFLSLLKYAVILYILFIIGSQINNDFLKMILFGITIIVPFVVWVVKKTWVSEITTDYNKQSYADSYTQSYADTTTDEDRLVSQMDNLTNGYEFENYIAGLLERNGYGVKITPKSGDYGVDVIAEKNTKRYAIQCKLHSKPVGVKAVQEVASGRDFYNCDTAIVATSNTFTPNAETLAQKTNVVLWDRQTIIRIIYGSDEI